MNRYWTKFSFSLTCVAGNKRASVLNLCRSLIFLQKSYTVTEIIQRNFTPCVSGCCKDAILWFKWAPAKQNKYRYLSPRYLKITLQYSFCSNLMKHGHLSLCCKSACGVPKVYVKWCECWKVELLGGPKMLSIMSVLMVFFVLPVSVSNMNHTPWTAQPGCSRHHHSSCVCAWTPLGGLFVGTTPICPERPKKSLFARLRGSSFCWVNSWHVAWHLNCPLSPVLGARLKSLLWGGFLGFSDWEWNEISESWD